MYNSQGDAGERADNTVVPCPIIESLVNVFSVVRQEKGGEQETATSVLYGMESHKSRAQKIKADSKSVIKTTNDF